LPIILNIVETKSIETNESRSTDMIIHLLLIPWMECEGLARAMGRTYKASHKLLLAAEACWQG
jgi:hypothetical protein